MLDKREALCRGEKRDSKFILVWLFMMLILVWLFMMLFTMLVKVLIKVRTCDGEGC